MSKSKKKASLNLQCTPKCPYFTNPNIGSSDWIFSDEKGYKVLRIPLVLKCGYDGEPIDWHRICPRIGEKNDAILR